MVLVTVFLFMLFIHTGNCVCFVETAWDRFMEVLLSESYQNMTTDLCMEGCLSVSKCTGMALNGIKCSLYGKVYNYGLSGCSGTGKYWKRTIGCSNPASNVSLKIGDAAGKQITYVYNVWTNSYTFAGNTIPGVLSRVQSASNIQYVYETDWKTGYINRIDPSKEGFINYQIDFPAEQVSSISVTAGENALFGAGSFVEMRACSWTNCQLLSPQVQSLLYPAAGSIFSSPFRFSLRLGGPVNANPQAYRYMYNATKPNPKNLDIIFNLK